MSKLEHSSMYSIYANREKMDFCPNLLKDPIVSYAIYDTDVI